MTKEAQQLSQTLVATMATISKVDSFKALEQQWATQVLQDRA